MPPPAGCTSGPLPDWERTYRELAAGATARDGSAGDLDRLATAAYLTGRAGEAFALWERAHRACLAAGDAVGAARSGIRLAECLGFQGDLTRAGGWVDRVRHLLDEARADCVERGYTEHATALCRIVGSGDVAGAHEGFLRAMRTAARFADRELATLARIGVGRCLIYLGEVAEGLRHLDEAMVAVEAREIPAVAVGDSYCTVIDACQELFDVPRVDAWTASFTRWFRSQPGLATYGAHLALHRAELLLLRGAWSAALDEAGRAVRGLSEPENQLVLGGAYYVRAELRRLRGEFRAADDDYRAAHEHGCEPHPGLALLRLAEGRGDAAEAAVRRLAAEAEGPVARGRVLGPYAEIVLARGDGAAAAAAADQLAAVARHLGSGYLDALASSARGAAHVAAGEARAALPLLRRAGQLWAELRVPYEGARTRVLLARACAELGDRETADLELDAAAVTFRELGARPEETRLDRARPPAAGPLTAREVEVLVRLARGHTNRAIARDLVISERTVATHVGHIFTKLDLPSRAAATAYAYERGLVGGPQPPRSSNHSQPASAAGTATKPPIAATGEMRSPSHASSSGVPKPA
ncbi:LuxR C-terminal-related transcriptional regulator [Geodermatophilus sp. SYSU D00691]